MNKRLWIVIAILVVAVVGGALLLTNREDTLNTDALDGTRLLTQEDVGENQIPDHFIGSPDAKVIAIEYTDFACIHCNQLRPDLVKIHDDYKDRVLFIHRNFSLGYPNSNFTAEAAEAAWLVGGDDAYWKMSDLLWQNTMWTSQAVEAKTRKETLDNYAKEVGIDVAKFNEAIENRRDNGINAKIKRDKSLGMKVGVTGTPTFFMNGERVGKATNTDIRDAIDAALKDVGLETGAKNSGTDYE